MPTDKRTNWVDALYVACDSHFTAHTGFTGDCFDLNSTRVHLWNLSTEQKLHKRRITTTDDQLWTTRAALNIFQVDLEALAWIVALTLDLFAARHNALRFAELQANNIAFNTAYHRIHDSTNFIFILGKYDFALCFTKTLQNHLFCGHSSHATKAFDFLVLFNHIAKLGKFVDLTSVNGRNLRFWVFHLLDDFLAHKCVNLTTV